MTDIEFIELVKDDTKSLMYRGYEFIKSHPLFFIGFSVGLILGVLL